MEDNKNNISEKNINTDKYEKTQNNTNHDSQTKENNIASNKITIFRTKHTSAV